MRAILDDPDAPVQDRRLAATALLRLYGPESADVEAEGDIVFRAEVGEGGRIRAREYSAREHREANRIVREVLDAWEEDGRPKDWNPYREIRIVHEGEDPLAPRDGE